MSDDKTCQWSDDDPWVDYSLDGDATPPPPREVCAAVATHRGCQPFTGAVTCEAHKCRCARPIGEAPIRKVQEVDVADRRAARWKALAKVLHADEIHYQVVKTGQKYRIAASRSATSVVELRNKIEEKDAEIAELRVALEDAFEGMVDVSEYFRKKREHDGYVDRARAVLKKWRPDG